MIARSRQHRSRRSRHRPRHSRHPPRRRRSPCPASFAARSPAIRSPRPRTGPIEGSTARARRPPRRRPGFGSAATCAPPGDARRCLTPPSATPGPGAGRRPSRRESAPPVSSSWTTSRVGRGRLPPRCHFVSHERFFAQLELELSPFHQTQQHSNATKRNNEPCKDPRRIESVVGLFTQGQLPIGN